MPPLDTRLHLETLKKARELGQTQKGALYGLQWGDPDSDPVLQGIRDHWLLPYVDGEKTALEIGPGGGRWTRYLLPFRRLYVVDYHAELLEELRKNFSHTNIVEVLNHGNDFPGVPWASVDFVFSFGVFVHLDADIISEYLANLHLVIHPATQLVIQYSDKDKLLARQNRSFSDNDPRRMRAMVERACYRIEEEDAATLDHSAIMRFTPA